MLYDVLVIGSVARGQLKSFCCVHETHRSCDSLHQTEINAFLMDSSAALSYMH
jgi:hypothetical protein